MNRQSETESEKLARLKANKHAATVRYRSSPEGRKAMAASQKAYKERKKKKTLRLTKDQLEVLKGLVWYAFGGAKDGDICADLIDGGFVETETKDPEEFVETKISEIFVLLKAIPQAPPPAQVVLGRRPKK